MSKIYLASSWRNENQNLFVKWLREHGHEVYDFKNPPNGSGGFSWSQIDPMWQKWTAKEYVNALNTKIAQDGFRSDLNGMLWADTGILLLPCGRSAHLEIGYMAGLGKRTLVLTRNGEEPELMALLCSKICTSSEELLKELY